MIERHVYGIASNNLKGKLGRSKNDHCLIHHEKYFKMEKVKCGIVLTCDSSTQYDMQEGNKAADLSLHVPADRKQISQLCIIGLAANYKDGLAKSIRMEIDYLDETSIVK